MAAGLFDRALDRIMAHARRQVEDLLAALPALRATETLLAHLQNAGLEAEIADVYDGRVYAVHIVLHGARYERVIDLLVGLQLPFALLVETERSRTYTVDVGDRQVNLLIPLPERRLQVVA